MEELDSARGSLKGQIVIGTMQLAGSFLLASVLNEFISTYPNPNIRILNGGAAALRAYGTATLIW
jgi:DNA-binding transcriptional LysR family regulator